jgi:hypothetical protein
VCVKSPVTNTDLELAAPRGSAMLGGVGRKIGRWARARVPELIALGVGVLLRLSMALTYDARIGYDFNSHWPYIQYLVARHDLPALPYNASSYHPPLYYLMAAFLVAHGLGAGALGWLAALCGMIRLGIVWVGLERWLPESRLARIVALALAAVIPPAVQLDGMITNETLFVLLAAAALVVTPAAIAATRAGRVGMMVGLGLLTALAMMSKISASVLVMSVGAAIALEIARAWPSWWPALRARALPIVAGAVVLACLTGPFFIRNQILYGKMAPTGYEGALKPNQAVYEGIPYFERRPLAFYVGWTPQIYVHPVVPTGLKPNARFFPVLIATTFNDYYIYGYSGGGKYGQQRWVSAAGVTLGCLSVAGGTLIALVTTTAWFGAVRRLWRRRRDGEPDPRFALLLVPLIGLLGQLHFAVKYPNDDFGPIKGAYLQFVAPVLCAMFGVGVAWMWRRGRRLWRVGAVVALGGLALVAVYSLHARFPPLGKNANTAAPFFMQPGAEKWK